MRRVVHWSLIVVCVIASGFDALAQEPETRAETLRRQREEKAQELRPPEPSGMERWLLRLEDGRLFERLLNPAEGFYPKIGSITLGSGFGAGPAYRTPGAGFAVGPAYRHPRLIGPADFSTFASVSMLGYWMVEGRLGVPHIANERVAVDVYGQASDFPRERFYGVGPDSSREQESIYGVSSTVIGASTKLTARPWLLFGGSIERLAPEVNGTDDDDSIDQVFTPDEAPGLGAPPSMFMRYTATAEVNYREPRGNPRRGGRYAVTVQRFDDRTDGLYSFDRVEVDVQQYVPLYKDRRVLALRALGSVSGNGTVPFYLQRTLGGPDDLRGFRRFRFRDENMLLLQAEYRWEIFTAVDGAIFYDRGGVAPTVSALSFGDMDSDYGIGFRFGTRNGVFLRIEGAFGSREGKHFVMRFGHVF